MASAKEELASDHTQWLRTSELATLLSAVAIEENALKRTNSSPDAGEDYSADERVLPPIQNDGMVPACKRTFPACRRSSKDNEQIHSGRAAAVKAGLATMSVTFEDVVTKGTKGAMSARR